MNRDPDDHNPDPKPDPMANAFVSPLAGDPLMADLLRQFLEDLPKRADTVVEAWESGEAQGLRRIAHQLKGSCAGYGFPTIGDAAARLENLLQAGTRLESVASEVRVLADLCHRAAAGGANRAA